MQTQFSYQNKINTRPTSTKMFAEAKPQINRLDYPIIQNYIGIHYRNTDIKTNLNSIISKVLKNKYNNIYNNIYLATDDSSAYDKLKAAFPNHNIYQYTKPINSNGEPIHYKCDDKYNLVLNLLIDLYFLYNSNEFVNSEYSLVSNFVLSMRNENKSIFSH